MSSELVSSCVEALVAARRSGIWLERWAADTRPVSLEQAYAIQEAVAVRVGVPTVGWKLGCTSVEMQQKLGSDGPIAGRAFATGLHRGTSAIDGARPDMLGLEAEFAFCMAADLPPRAAAYGEDEVRAAIGSLHPAIEQIESRFSQWQGLPILDIVADNASHGRLVIGDPVSEWQGIALPNCPIRLWADDTLVAEGFGSHVLGDPLSAMVWLANDLSRRGLGLRRGEFVITGTCTGLNFVRPGAKARVEIPGRGEVSLVFPAVMTA